MKDLLILFLIIFVAIWGVSTLISYFASSKGPIPNPKSFFSSGSLNLEQQHNTAREIKTETERLMEDHDYDLEQYRRMKELPPPTGLGTVSQF